MDVKSYPNANIKNKISETIFIFPITPIGQVHRATWGLSITAWNTFLFLNALYHLC